MFIFKFPQAQALCAVALGSIAPSDTILSQTYFDTISTHDRELT